jgi:hypothetical protein
MTSSLDQSQQIRKCGNLVTIIMTNATQGSCFPFLIQPYYFYQSHPYSCSPNPTTKNYSSCFQKPIKSLLYHSRKIMTQNHTSYSHPSAFNKVGARAAGRRAGPKVKVKKTSTTTYSTFSRRHWPSLSDKISGAFTKLRGILTRNPDRKVKYFIPKVWWQALTKISIQGCRCSPYAGSWR